MNNVANLVFPPACELCEGLCDDKTYEGICKNCKASIPTLKAPFCVCGKSVAAEGLRCIDCHRETFHFDRAIACLPYEGKTKELILAYKYKGRKHLKHLFSSYMNNRLSETILSFDTITAVPMDEKKMISRGFSPAKLLAREIARKTGKPLAVKSLKRLKSGPSQSWLNKRGRVENIRNSFQSADARHITGKRILLVDDILTTGQTASECARLLKSAGASSVTVLACARGTGS
jgi:ComF family protein